MQRITWTAALLIAIIGFTACGGDSGGSSGNPSSPSTPTAPTTPTNRAPVISSTNVSPAWGVSTLTMHSFSASATDPDGDSIKVVGLRERNL